MTECSACGQCCRAIALPYSRIEILTGRTPPGFIDPATRALIVDHMRPIGRHEVQARAPWQQYPTLVRSDHGMTRAFFFACDYLDLDSGLCTNHEGRPPLCSDFPLYGRPEVRADAALPPSCSYRADLGETPDPPEQWQPVKLERR